MAFANGALASGEGERGAAIVWDLETQKPIASFAGPAEGFTELVALAISPDGLCMATGGFDGTVRLRTLKAQTSSPYRLPPKDRPLGFPKIFGLAFLSDGTKIIAGCDDGTVCLLHGLKKP